MANAGKLKALSIDWGKGQGCIAPSNENVLKGTYNPLSRPLFIYVSKKSADKPEVKQFVEFGFHQGARPGQGGQVPAAAGRGV